MKAKAVRKTFAGAIVCASALVLSGCKVFVKEEPPPCPRVSILADAANIVQFRPGPGHDISDVLLKAQLVRYQGSCYFDKDSKAMTVTLQVGFDVTRGAALPEDGKGQLNYFVAVPNFWPQPEAKQVLNLPIEFPKGATGLKVTDHEVNITFPVHNIKALEPFEVFVGLQLDPAQLEYNREKKPN